MIKMLLTVALFVAVTSAETLWDHEVKKDLMNDYNANALPSNGATDVSLLLKIYGIISVDTVTSQASFKVALR